ncbi:AraC family transcriptional regulator [Rhodoferax saidenbachensis]|uniref:AraC-like DNA-binding protein n=1 Tax=Rhodoferax saidenbachensis TaxID=1484693 RepID=A0ABU1ZNC1_9BURK|nr:AraC family transcriptional regulator [Rhodoferax saidenbachensis]MDR7307055.1 AraC-like DNA-binding protein [Rhodoferax saidenbachensis]
MLLNHQAASSVIEHLRSMVAARAAAEGRTDSLYPGLRYYRFSHPIEYTKAQRLAPGIVVVLQGGKTANLGGQLHAYDPLHYLVLGGETVCHGTVVTASSDCPYLAIHLDLPPAALVKTFVTLAEKQGALAPTPVRENFVSPVDTGVLQAFVRLLPTTDTALDCATLAPLVVEEIVVRLIRSNAAFAIRNAAAMGRSATRIQKSIQFIQANFAGPLSVGGLADHAAMSPSHYAHSFRQVAGVSPMRYLRDVRLDQARVLMLGSPLRPSEVAEQVGFESAAHFTREFKRRFEVSPTEYSRRLRDADRSKSAAAVKETAVFDIAAHRRRS